MFKVRLKVRSAQFRLSLSHAGKKLGQLLLCSCLAGEETIKIPLCTHEFFSGSDSGSSHALEELLGGCTLALGELELLPEF